LGGEEKRYPEKVRRSSPMQMWLDVGRVVAQIESNHAGETGEKIISNVLCQGRKELCKTKNDNRFTITPMAWRGRTQGAIMKALHSTTSKGREIRKKRKGTAPAGEKSKEKIEKKEKTIHELPKNSVIG